MKRKTILTLAAVGVVGALAAVSIPALAGGPGGCWGPGPGFGMMGHRGGPGGGFAGMHGPMGWRGGPGAMGGFANSAIYKSFDANGDGVVTPAEAEAGIAKLATKYDANHDGSLSREEFGKLFADATQGFADRPFAMLDANKDGRLSADEMKFPAQMMARVQAWHGRAQSDAPATRN